MRDFAILLFLAIASLASSLRLTAQLGRRDAIVATATAIAAGPSAALATGNMPAVTGSVNAMDGNVKKAATPEAAKTQIAAGYKALGALIDDFEKISSTGGGDGIRRVIGTVGTASPCYLIEPAFRLLFDADDSLPMEYIESVESLMQNLASADSEAYSAIFIEFSSAKGKPEDYFKRSKAAVIRARTDWLSLMKQLQMEV